MLSTINDLGYVQILDMLENSEILIHSVTKFAQGKCKKDAILFLTNLRNFKP